MKNKNNNNIISFLPNASKLERQVEAILFAASEPLDIETIENLVLRLDCSSREAGTSTRSAISLLGKPIFFIPNSNSFSLSNLDSIKD